MLVEQTKTLVDSQTNLIKELQKQKLEQQCNVELKEIRHEVGEVVWDFDHRFKDLLGKLTLIVGCTS